MVAEALKAGVTPENVEREKKRLKLKRHRILKQHREGYIDDEEFQGEMAAVELAIRQLDAPEVEGITYDEVIEAGEHLPGMAALWDEATVEERYEMVTIILEPGGLYYDLENKIIAAIKPHPAFLPVLRMLNGVMEFDETRGLLVTEHWCDRNRRESGSRQLHQWDRVWISFPLQTKKKWDIVSMRQCPIFCYSTRMGQDQSRPHSLRS